VLSSNSSPLAISDGHVDFRASDQSAWAFEYRSATCCRYSDENPMIELLEYWSMYLFTYKEQIKIKGVVPDQHICKCSSYYLPAIYTKGFSISPSPCF
jgi:hypothetical protein